MEVAQFSTKQHCSISWGIFVIKRLACFLIIFHRVFHLACFRFDLIFLMLDPQDETYDRRLGRHLVSLYYRTAEQSEEESLDMSVLRDYITYAKQTFQPKLTEEAGTELIQSYVKMRQVGSGRGQVTAFPRQLESLIR